jgi:hypothetical protein
VIPSLLDKAEYKWLEGSYGLSVNVLDNVIARERIIEVE